MPRITINISKEEKEVLGKRAKKNFLTLIEQIEDIIRRSSIRAVREGKRLKLED